ncbi:MAG: DUF2321 domain-containing protein [Eubacterium sp.]|nr:DUF2321 domain-containing protein [Eubacterium sp.]
MPDYYAKVCLNGHTLIKRFPINNVEYCEECGSLMICFCQNCDTIIKEWHYDDMLVLFPSSLLSSFLHSYLCFFFLC